jgi:hypothetical protein
MLKYNIISCPLWLTKKCGGVDPEIDIFLTSALVESGQLHAPAALPLGKKPPVPIG